MRQLYVQLQHHYLPVVNHRIQDRIGFYRGNFSAAAGFGFDADKFGVFSTFSAFLEMVVSEITMARLNNCNVLCHFSHAGGKFAILFQ